MENGILCGCTVEKTGKKEGKTEKCMEYKRQMFDAFHKQMPDAKFVIMSGLLLPGRAECLDLTLTINEKCWYNESIKPAIEQVIKENGFDSLRK